MRKLIWAGCGVLLVLLPALGATPAAAAPADDAGTVAGVLTAQQRLGPVPVRRPVTPAATDSFAIGAALDTVAVGTGHTCVSVLYSYVWCWGEGGDGQLGDGTTTDAAEPVLVSGHLRDKLVLGLAAGRAHTCALALEDEGFGTYCWGANDDGQLGDGSTDDQTRPEEVATDVIGLSTGADHTCVVGVDLMVSCWGRNDQGQLGVDTAGASSPSPQEVAGLADVVDVAAGTDSTCAADADGRAYCWGGLTGSDVPAALPGADYSQVTVGRAHACGLVGSALTGGQVHCWGADDRGQLGTGSGTVDSAVPVPVAGHRAYVSVSAAGDSTCAVTATGQGYCWGANDDGQLGTGDTEQHLTPVAVDQSRVTNSQVVRELYGARESMIVNLTAGPDRSCAVSVEQATYCTRGRLLTKVPLGPGPPRDVRATPRDASLAVTWSPPARTGAAPLLGYAAVAASAGLRDGMSCETRKPGCTVPDLTNNRRYAVFVVALSTGGMAYSAITYAAPAGGGAGGSLPITGPQGPVTTALALLGTGAALLLVTRDRRRVR
ncbi:MAG TPA: fibronectin type III domain-containing protein [Actinoplanes sp.]|nr:fibronectin type III domain-containing protein [Actinoplanes sp.]